MKQKTIYNPKGQECKCDASQLDSLVKNGWTLEKPKEKPKEETTEEKSNKDEKKKGEK